MASPLPSSNRRLVRVAGIPATVGPAEADPDHYPRRNGRPWWIAFTVHRGHLQERVRHSLVAADRAEARRRRDEVLARYQRAGDCQLSLRFDEPRGARARSRRRSAEGRANRRRDDPR